MLIENCYLKGVDTWLPHATQLLFVTTEVIATSLTLANCANVVKVWENWVQKYNCLIRLQCKQPQLSLRYMDTYATATAAIYHTVSIMP